MVEQVDAGDRLEVVVHVERIDEIVDHRRVARRHEAGFVRQIQRLGIGAEIMIKCDVFLEDNDQVLDRGRGVDMARIVAIVIVAPIVIGRRTSGRDCKRQRGHASEKCWQTHMKLPLIVVER